MNAGGRFPDLNGAAAEIAAANDILLPLVKLALLDLWLPTVGPGGAGNAAASACDLDETISNFKLTYGSKSSNGGGDDDENAVNFLRCAYLAQDADREVLEYLVTVGFSKDATVRLEITFHFICTC